MKDLYLLTLTLFFSCYLSAQKQAIGIEFQNSLQVNTLTHQLNNQFIPFLELIVSYSERISNNFSLAPRLGISYLLQREQKTDLVDRLALLNNVSNPTWQDSPDLVSLSMSNNWPYEIYYNTLYVESGILIYYHFQRLPELSLGLGPMVRIPFYYTNSTNKTNGFKNIDANFVERIDPSIKFEIAHSIKINERLSIRYASNYTRNFIASFHENLSYQNSHYWGGVVGLNIGL